MSFTTEEFPDTSYYKRDLREIIATLRKLVKESDVLTEWMREHQKEFDEIKKIYDKIASGNLPPEISNSLYNWCRENITSLVGELVHNVFFELTDSGYFVANIPESWDDIIFNTTGLDIELELQPAYGYLVLSY